MRQLLRSLAALGLMYAAGAAVGAAEQALRDPRARRGAPPGQAAGMVAPDTASMKCSYGIHEDCLYVGNCACACHAPAPIEEPPALDRIEFYCRHLMAELSRMEVRGFDTGRAKDEKRAELDEQLDLFNLTKALEA